MATNSQFVGWLNDAHAMEKSIVQALESQVTLAKDHPMVQQGIQRHLDATKRHAEIVEGCLDSLGETSSGMKDTMAAVGGKMQGMMPMGMGDGLVKAALQDYAIEHMEIASYQALILASNELGHPEIASKLQGILEDEEAMAKWLEQNTPALVREEISHSA